MVSCRAAVSPACLSVCLLSMSWLVLSLAGLLSLLSVCSPLDRSTSCSFLVVVLRRSEGGRGRERDALIAWLVFLLPESPHRPRLARWHAEVARASSPFEASRVRERENRSARPSRGKERNGMEASRMFGTAELLCCFQKRRDVFSLNRTVRHVRACSA